jgi:hypothetical protein
VVDQLSMFIDHIEASNVCQQTVDPQFFAQFAGRGGGVALIALNMSTSGRGPQPRIRPTGLWALAEQESVVSPEEKDVDCPAPTSMLCNISSCCDADNLIVVIHHIPDFLGSIHMGFKSSQPNQHRPQFRSGGDGAASSEGH